MAAYDSRLPTTSQIRRDVRTSGGMRLGGSEVMPLGAIEGGPRSRTVREGGFRQRLKTGTENQDMDGGSQKLIQMD